MAKRKSSRPPAKVDYIPGGDLSVPPLGTHYSYLAADALNDTQREIEERRKLINGGITPPEHNRPPEQGGRWGRR